MTAPIICAPCSDGRHADQKHSRCPDTRCQCACRRADSPRAMALAHVRANRHLYRDPREAVSHLTSLFRTLMPKPEPLFREPFMNQPVRPFPKIHLSKQTVVEVGHQLEQAVAFHILHDAPAPAQSASIALKKLRKALHLPAGFSFTSEAAREQERWKSQKRRRRTTP